MLLINNSLSSKTGVELYNGIEQTITAGEIFSCDDDKGRALVNQDSDFAFVTDLTTAINTLISTVTNDLVREETVEISSAELLALNTTPKALIAAPGTGYAINVLDVVVSMDYGSAAYATNTDLEIRYDNAAAGDAGGAEVTMGTFDAILLLTADAVATCSGLGQADETALTVNKGVSAIIATGDPITGDSPIKVKVRYQIVSV